MLLEIAAETIYAIKSTCGIRIYEPLMLKTGLEVDNRPYDRLAVPGG